MQLTNVSLAVRKDDWAKWLGDSTQKLKNEDISNTVYDFCFHLAETAFGEEYIKLDWFGVKWVDTGEEVQYILNWLNEIKHYDLVRIIDDEVFSDLHTGKNVLKIKHYACLNEAG